MDKDLNVPGFNFHGLQGVPIRYSIHINGPWCVSHLSGRRMRRCGSILNNIIEVKLWESIPLNVLYPVVWMKSGATPAAILFTRMVHLPARHLYPARAPYDSLSLANVA